MGFRDKTLAAFARDRGLDVTWPDSIPLFDENAFATGNIALGQPLPDELGQRLRSDVTIDFGKLRRAIPRAVLHPASVENLLACMRFCADHGTPFKTRAAGHSANGSTLSDGGIVLDLSRLAGIVSDEGTRVRVRAGTPWLHLARHLMRTGRRVPVMTDNPHTTVGGTLSVGGFGDATHRVGLQIDHVDALSVATFDGLVETTRGEALHAYTLGGSGQLGVVVDATIPVIEAPPLMTARVLTWPDLPAFVRGAVQSMKRGGVDHLRARCMWNGFGPPGTIVAIAGCWGFRGPADDALDALAPSTATPPETMPLYASDAPGQMLWALPCPALEMTVPLIAALDMWPSIAGLLRRTGLDGRMPHGTSVMVVRPSSLPLAPIPPHAEYSLNIALRPAVNLDEVPLIQEAWKVFEERILDVGGRIYLVGHAPRTRAFLKAQYGDALAQFRKMKRTYDADGLCNPGLLTPEGTRAHRRA